MPIPSSHKALYFLCFQLVKQLLDFLGNLGLQI